MNRSTVIVSVCILAIAGSAAWLVLRPKSPAAKARAEAERRKCFECGCEWSKDRGELIRESKSAPPGSGAFVRCPECKAWAGMSVIHCEQCGRNFTSHVIISNDDGTLAFPKQRVCPYCHTHVGATAGEDASGTE